MQQQQYEPEDEKMLKVPKGGGQPAEEAAEMLVGDSTRLIRRSYLGQAARKVQRAEDSQEQHVQSQARLKVCGQGEARAELAAAGEPLQITH
jgi:hypothetical protein